MNFLKNIGLKIKIAIGAVIAVLGIILFFFVRQKIRAKEQMEFQLSEVNSQIELAKLEQDALIKEEKLKTLKEQETLIREKIEYLEKVETTENREVSMEELDAFFDKRGF